MGFPTLWTYFKKIQWWQQAPPHLEVIPFSQPFTIIFYISETFTTVLQEKLKYSVVTPIVAVDYHPLS